MAKTNWQDPLSSEIRSTHISGLQEAVGKIEESIGIASSTESNITLSEVLISNDDRFRIYQAPEGKRNWLSSPAPVIKKNGIAITGDFEIDYGGGAIIFTNPVLETDVVTADATYTKKNNLYTDFNSHLSDIAYGAKSNGMKGDNTTDDYTKFNALITAIGSERCSIFFPRGIYIIGSNITIPSNIRLIFDYGAMLNLNTGVTITINGIIDAGAYQIFTGSGNISGVIHKGKVAWFGGLVDDGVTDTIAIQKAIKLFDVVEFEAGNYNITSQIDIPENKSMQWIGKGFRNTIINIGSNIVGFSYVKTNGTPSSTLNIVGISFAETNLGKTSVGIKFHGYNESQNDCWLRMYDCSIYGFARGVWLKNCGQCHFEGNFAQKNSAVYFLERAASFIYFDRCMNLDNDFFIFAEDTLADGISNGIVIDNCHSVWGKDVDIRIQGWQAVWVDKCGFDLGTGGVSAVVLLSVSNFRLTNCWIASDEVTAPDRAGILLINCNVGSIGDCDITNSEIGIRIEGTTSYSTKVSIHDCNFEGNDKNDILLFNANAVRIRGCHFSSTPDRTGTNYEIYSVTSNYNIVKDNTFRQSTYPIGVGANSIVSDNIFSVIPA